MSQKVLAYSALIDSSLVEEVDQRIVLDLGCQVLITLAAKGFVRGYEKRHGKTPE